MNDNKLGRFIKVMTGGNLITDKTLASRLGKVNAAILQAQAEQQRLTDVGLTDATLDQLISDTEDARDLALRETGNADQYDALEQVKADARLAAAQCKTKADAGLVLHNQRDTDLNDIDTDLGALENIWHPFTDAPERALYDARTQALDTRRDLLGNADTVVLLQQQLNLVAALKADIATATNDAQQSALDLVTAQNARTPAVQSLTNATGWATWLDRVATPNPARTEVNRLEAEKTRIDQLPAASRATDYGVLRTDANAVGNGCNAALATIQRLQAEIPKECHAMTTIVSRFVPPDTTGLAGRIATLQSGLAAAVRTAATTAAIAGAVTALENTIAPLRTAVANAEAARTDLAAQQDSVEKCLASADAAIQALRPPVPALAQELVALRQRQTTATGETNATAAKRLFLPLGRDAADLLTRAKTAELKAKAGSVMGREEIDDLVAEFGKTTGNAHDQAMMQAALSARFNMEVVVQPGAKADRLPMLYDLFRKLPAGHMGHDQLGRLEHGTLPSTAGNTHTPVNATVPGSKGVIKFNDLPEDDSVYDFIADDNKRVSATFFKATALHEAGHGVDARFNVMTANKTGAGFGKWGDETATSVAGKYGARLAVTHAGPGKTPLPADLVTFAEALLTTGACTKPANAAAPLGSLFDTWDTIIADPVVALCHAARNTARPWDTGDTFANQAKMPDNRVYFEAYAGIWYSYDFAERAATGVSSYQWRSPVEWFAELYALYHTKGKRPPASVAGFITG